MSVEYALRNLRHLYEQMISGDVLPCAHDIANAARGLLGPAIEEIERFVMVRCAECGIEIAEPCYYPGSRELCDQCGK